MAAAWLMHAVGELTELEQAGQQKEEKFPQLACCYSELLTEEDRKVYDEEHGSTHLGTTTHCYTAETITLLLHFLSHCIHLGQLQVVYAHIFVTSSELN